MPVVRYVKRNGNDTRRIRVPSPPLLVRNLARYGKRLVRINNHVKPVQKGVEGKLITVFPRIFGIWCELARYS